MVNRSIILEVNLGSMISETGLRGEFERKIGVLIETVFPYENVALFVDEGYSIVHTRSDGVLALWIYSNLLCWNRI
ncbi:ATP-dependent Clp protease ATP-binding subunit ClpA [Bartonella callosciuri]|uniref:ATP-dependent Clp protease ATP-binding subunit ClpA n=1 Tax=Bartonella callosciuri TaxID=686223 RepID=A0A840NQT1_9HYPH|nr:ATP-dependent Clp protease ATP-binding subunit ClpA [Bartonella callosciuri]